MYIPQYCATVFLTQLSDSVVTAGFHKMEVFLGIQIYISQQFAIHIRLFSYIVRT